MLNTSRKEKLDGKKQLFLWFAGCRGAMAFALSIKSIIDFPENGKIFLVITLIIALFTLLYSTFFLDCTLRKCEITNFCNADNFDENILSKNPNCFDRFKLKIMNFNESYLKKCIKVPEGSEGDLQNDNNIDNDNDNDNDNINENYLDSSIDDIGFHLDYFRKKYLVNKVKGKDKDKEKDKDKINDKYKEKEMKSLSLNSNLDSDENEININTINMNTNANINSEFNSKISNKKNYNLDTDSDFSSNLSKDNFNELN